MTLSAPPLPKDAIKSTEPIQQLLETVSLYLHIPFCHTRCHYCDFNTYAGILPMREPYVRALLTEITLAGQMAQHGDRSPRRSRTIFFGGGTPSLLSVSQITDLLEACYSSFAVDKDAEITLEANPGTLDQEQLAGLRAAGINRLSMGAQSFDAGLLKALGRIHTPEEVQQAVYYARNAGFTSINLDLMFGLPEQTMDHWHETLDCALALHPEHLSLYSLIIEEDTPFYDWVHQGRITPGDEDLCADMYEYADEYLGKAGYTNYEISNWTLPGHHSRHNLTYWQNLPYIGMGAGAHSCFGGRRFSNERNPSIYVKKLKGDKYLRLRAKLSAISRQCPKPRFSHCAPPWDSIYRPLKNVSPSHLSTSSVNACRPLQRQDYWNMLMGGCA